MEVTTGQKILRLTASIVAVVGIYFFMDSQVDMRDGFALGVYIASSLGVVYAIHRFSKGAKNLD
jgi:hypothetical protein